MRPYKVKLHFKEATIVASTNYRNKTALEHRHLQTRQAPKLGCRLRGAESVRADVCTVGKRDTTRSADIPAIHWTRSGRMEDNRITRAPCLVASSIGRRKHSCGAFTKRMKSQRNQRAPDRALQHPRRLLLEIWRSHGGPMGTLPYCWQGALA